MKIFLGIVYIIICAFIMGVVLKQEGKQQGLGAIGGGNTDTYWARNKGRSREGVLKRMTIIAAALFILLSIGLNLLFKGETAASTVLTTENGEEIDMEQLQELLGDIVIDEDDTDAEGADADTEGEDADTESEESGD